jgi:release factor glutamine methyltransferase
LSEELSARLGSTEAGFVLCDVSGRRTADLVRIWNEPVDPDVADAAHTIARRVESGEPLQHVLGRWGFRSLDLLVDVRALIPRPETEIVVEDALGAIDRVAAPGPTIVLDLGVGSGAIACALVSERDGIVVIGVDRAPAALALAAENRALLGPARGRLQLLGSDWYSALAPLAGKVAVIVSNPPYLSSAEWTEAPPIVREWDPYDALVAGVRGTEAIAVVVAGAPRMLVPGGALVVEIGATQGAAARSLAIGAGAQSVEIHRDLAGRDRVLVATW